MLCFISDLKEIYLHARAHDPFKIFKKLNLMHIFLNSQKCILVIYLMLKTFGISVKYDT